MQISSFCIEFLLLHLRPFGRKEKNFHSSFKKCSSDLKFKIQGIYELENSTINRNHL